MPWRLAELTGISTFNAARADPFNALKRQELKSIEVIIYCSAEFLLGRLTAQDSINALLTYRDKPHYIPTVTHNPELGLNQDKYTAFDHFKVTKNVPAQRWLFSLSRYLPRVQNDLEVLLQGQPLPRLFETFTKDEQALQKAIDYVVLRKGVMESQNFKYVFVVFPAKQSIFADQPDVPTTDPFTSEFLSNFLEELKKRNIATIDLLSPMRQAQNKLFYQSYDTHLTAEGLNFVSKHIADYLQNNNLLPKTEPTGSKDKVE